MIYGANGYTGALIAERAVASGLRPVLAGRSREAIVAQAKALSLPYRVFALDDAQALTQALDEVALVVHAAGPFSRTSKPMVDACITTGTHYLDITGEIEVFEAILRRDEEAKAASVLLVPGAGFDVVPTDCLAAKLAEALPGGTRLELAFSGLPQVSAGTARTMIEGIPDGGAARIGGVITPVPVGWRTRLVPFADKTRFCVSIPWGDVSTAWYSTGVSDITTYMATRRTMLPVMRMAERLAPVLSSRPVQRGFQALAGRFVRGPGAEARAQGRSQVWGALSDAAGHRVAATLSCPEGYSLTVDACLAAVERVLLASFSRHGALTPSMAFSSSFVDGLEGVTVGAIIRS